MAFATTLELEDWVQGEVPADTATLALDRASASVATSAGRFGATISEVADDVEVLDSHGGKELLLKHWPVTDVSAVTVDGTDPDYWEWSRTGRLARTSGKYWPAGLREVTVTYTHGFPADEIPDEIKTVTLAVAARIVANPQSLQQFNKDGASFPVGTHVDVATLTDKEEARVVEAMR